MGPREPARRQLARYDDIRFVHHRVTPINGDAERGFVATARAATYGTVPGLAGCGVAGDRARGLWVRRRRW
ncbi:hypothetical protein [Nonomuraea sp. NPDC049400]|uniref:hypothetical protein n=1 Tax=Nonomuraea sp. NPDC049400 TaxID=3364352 RepID=UPI003798F240